MDNIKGIVLRVEERHIAVVTEEGEFIRVPMPATRPLPGDRVDIPVKQKRNYRPFIAIAAMLMVIIGFTVFKPVEITPAIASVTIDLTPSIELTVGKDNIVTGAQAHNSEGEQLLEKIDVRNLDIYQAVTLVTAKAAEMGFLKMEDKNLAIATVVPLGDGRYADILDKDKIMQTIHDEMSNREFAGYVVVNQAQQEVQQQADAMGLTINRYLLMEKSKEQGVEIELEVLKDTPMMEVMQATQLEVQQVFAGEWCNVNSQRWGTTSPVINNWQPPSGTNGGENSADGENESEITEKSASPNNQQNSWNMGRWHSSPPNNHQGTPWSEMCD